MTAMEWLELLSYFVTVVGFPYAIAVYVWEKRMERANDDEEIYSRLSSEYTDFLKLLLDHADLQLIGWNTEPQELTYEQQERVRLIYGILVSLFERAYLLVYDERMDRKTARLWASWEDYIREWCRRADFRRALPALLQGEDPEFADLVRRYSDDEARLAAAREAE